MLSFGRSEILNFMCYRAIWLVSMGFFFGSVFGRMDLSVSYWVTTLAAIGMLVGIFGDAFHKSRQIAPKSPDISRTNQQKQAP